MIHVDSVVKGLLHSPLSPAGLRGKLTGTVQVLQLQASAGTVSSDKQSFLRGTEAPEPKHNSHHHSPTPATPPAASRDENVPESKKHILKSDETFSVGLNNLQT